jgi:hypothetical protein
MFLDLNDVIYAETRLANLTKMVDMTVSYWDEKQPVGELQSVVLTACYIYGLLIKELREITEKIDDMAAKYEHTERAV